MAAERDPGDAPPLIADLQRSLHSSDPFDVVAFVSAVMATLDRPDAPEGLPDLRTLAESFIDVDVEETTAALHVVSTLTPDDLLRRRIRAALAARHQRLPATVAELDRTRVTRALAVVETTGGSTNYVLECDVPGCPPMSFVVYVDHTRGGVVTDAFPIAVGVDGYLSFVAGTPEADLVRPEVVDLADARAALTAPLEASYAAAGPERESWPQCRPVVAWLLTLLPEGGTAPAPPAMPGISRGGRPSGPGAAFGLLDGPGAVPPDDDGLDAALSALGLSADDLADVLDADDDAPHLHPALEDLLDRLPPAAIVDLAALSASAAQTRDDIDPPDADQLAAAVRPWRLLLELAGDDGIELTSAGWMRPAAVEHLHTALGLDEVWIGKGNREDLTAPIARLREGAVRMKLLRKYKGRLLATRAARGLDDEGLWDHLAAHLIGPPGTAAADASILTVLSRAGGSHDDAGADLAAFMTKAGWSFRHRALGADDVADLARPVTAVLDSLAGDVLRRRQSVSPIVARFCADVVLRTTGAGPSR